MNFQQRKTKVPLLMGEQRLIIATCEKGTVEDLDEMKDIQAGLDAVKSKNPNYVDVAVTAVFRHRTVELVADPEPNTKGFFVSKAIKERAPLMASSSSRAPRTSHCRTWMRTSLPASSAFAWKRLTTSCGGIARWSLHAGRQQIGSRTS